MIRHGPLPNARPPAPPEEYKDRTEAYAAAAVRLDCAVEVLADVRGRDAVFNEQAELYLVTTLRKWLRSADNRLELLEQCLRTMTGEEGATVDKEPDDAR